MGLHHLLEGLLRARRGYYGNHGNHGHHGYGHHGYGHHHRHDRLPYERLLVCPDCGAQSALEARFCADCGHAFGGLQRAAQVVCPSCAASLPAGARFCPSCGLRAEGSILRR